MAQQQWLWKLERLSLAGTTTDRLCRLSLEIRCGVTAILGHSGAGKSSLLSILAGMERPSCGTVERGETLDFAGKNQLAAAQESAFAVPLFWAPQDAGLWPHLTARQHLDTVFERLSEVSGGADAKSDDRSDKLLEAFDLHHRQHAFPGELSRGEQSRLAIARALAIRPAVLILDEPLSHVDPLRRPVYWQQIRDYILRTQASLVFTTHEPEAVIRESSQVLCLREGRAVWHGATDDLYYRPPSKEVAEFLGPGNWFEPAEQAVWLADASVPSDRKCFRPESLYLEPSENGNAQILSFQFSGSYSETTLKHGSTSIQKTIIHRPSGNVHVVGQRVLLKVLS